MKNHRNLLIYQTSSLRQSDFQAYDKFLKYIKKIKIKKLILICIILVFTGCANQVSQVASYDIVIYGGTSAGVIAAVQAKKMGKSVVLIEPGEHLGGLSSAGLGATDIGNKAAIGGLSREFYHRLYLHYIKDKSWSYQKPQQFKRGGAYWQTGDQNWEKEQSWWLFEPHAAEEIFNDFVREYKVPVIFNQRLDLQTGVIKKAGRIIAIKTESGSLFKAKMFIDATYEGDLMAKAGVSYTIGREANSQYRETLNGVQIKNARMHQLEKCVDPYVVPGDPSSGLLPGIHFDQPGGEGRADHRVQAYCFRMCLTDVPENRISYTKPPNYNEKQFELLLRYYEAGYDRIPWQPVSVPNRKTDTNNRDGFSTDFIEMNYEYPDGNYAVRVRIISEHETYQKGLMWTLANNSRVPLKVRREVNRWGLAKDEFADNNNWPYQLYIREARRMVSDYVMTEKNCRRKEIAGDSIGLGAYNMDSHNTQRYIDSNDCVRNEGDIQVAVAGPYQISYRAIVPKNNECRNLLVPVCLSSSHIAYGSIRMEPVFMVLGQSAATAASIAIDKGLDIQKIDYQQLKKRLLKDKQIL